MEVRGGGLSELTAFLFEKFLFFRKFWSNGVGDELQTLSLFHLVDNT